MPAVVGTRDICGCILPSFLQERFGTGTSDNAAALPPPGSTADPTGLSLPLGTRSPKLEGCLKRKRTVIS